MGDYSKAKRQLGWEPKTRLQQLAELMVDADIESLGQLRRGDVHLSGEELETSHVRVETEIREVVNSF